MKIKLDENLPARLADVLRDLGHDVLTVFDENIRQAAILASCSRGWVIHPDGSCWTK